MEDAAVAERQQYLTISVRDYLNEHGKLVHSGETAGYFGALGSTIGGIYYGLDGAPSSDCVVTQDLFSDCLLLADDFYQYYLGAYSRSTATSPLEFNGLGDLSGVAATFGGPAVKDNPLNEAGTFTVTSDVLPPISSRNSPARPQVNTGVLPAGRSILSRGPGTWAGFTSTTPTCGSRGRST